MAVSFGDVYLMAKLAYRIGRAFTKGRAKAPAEFQELENQLYALSTALDEFKVALENEQVQLRLESQDDDILADSQGQSPVSVMLQNCQQTLQHLEKIVDKYGCLPKPKSSTPKSNGFRRWSEDIQRNWRQILWTTEEGDLATLHSQLTVHINSLHLILGVVTNTTTTRLTADVSRSKQILEDIYQWFLINLKNSPSGRTLDHNSDRQHGPEISAATFELQGEGIVCRHATFTSTKFDEASSLFRCTCTPTDPSANPPHQAHVAALKLYSSSYPVRVSGNPQSWILYNTRNSITNILGTITIKALQLKYLTLFEHQFVKMLQNRCAEYLLWRGKSTLMAHPSPTSQSIRLLNVIAECPQANTIDSATFISKSGSLTQMAIQSMHLLHYRSLPSSKSTPQHKNQSRCESFEPTVELVLFYEKEEQDETGLLRTVVKLRLNTEIELSETTSKVTSLKLKSTSCCAYSVTGQQSSIDCIDVILSFNVVAAAKNLRDKLVQMRMELLCISLQYPHTDESIVLQLVAGEVTCENVHIENATVTFVKMQTGKYRLIVQSLNGSTVLSQELASDFVSSWQPGSRPSFNLESFIIQMKDQNGPFRVLQRKEGPIDMQFEMDQSNRLLDLGFATMVKNTFPEDSMDCASS